jgi:alkanesulfonate monooxygenase
MPVEFIGIVHGQRVSEIYPPEGPVIDKSYVRAIASAHEAGGFDRVLIAHSSASPDGYLTAAHVFEHTERLGVLLAHRPGFVSPSLTARSLATLDQYSDGRLAVHIISGGDDAEQRRDGDYLTKDERYARTDEYLDIVNRSWSSEAPYDHHGQYYRLEGAFTSIKPAQKPRLPVYFGGQSDAAIRVAGKHADVFALWGESLAQVKETIARVRASAAQHGRADQISFSLSLRPIIAPTEEEAWLKADRILERAKEVQAQGVGRFGKRTAPPANEGSLRLLQTAAQGKVVDKRLWTEIAKLGGAQGNSTSLVGTPEQVTEALLDYYDLGVTTFLIRGFEPLEDAVHYGRDLIPLVRQAVAKRDASAPIRHAKAG